MSNSVTKVMRTIFIIAFAFFLIVLILAQLLLGKAAQEVYIFHLSFCNVDVFSTNKNMDEVCGDSYPSNTDQIYICGEMYADGGVGQLEIYLYEEGNRDPIKIVPVSINSDYQRFCRSVPIPKENQANLGLPRKSGHKKREDLGTLKGIGACG